MTTGEELKLHRMFAANPPPMPDQWMEHRRPRWPEGQRWDEQFNLELQRDIMNWELDRAAVWAHSYASSLLTLCLKD